MQQTETAAQSEAARSDGRRFAAWNIIERKEGEKPFWHRVGSGFINRDGSINVFLDSIPLQGKIQLRDDKDSRDLTQPITAQRRPRPPTQLDRE